MAKLIGGSVWHRSGPRPEPYAPEPEPIEASGFNDDFAGDGALVGYTTDNEEVLPDVARVAGRYRAHMTANPGNAATHYNAIRGRIDAKLLAFPFDVCARNIGIGTPEDSQAAAPTGQDSAIFCGLEVHSTDFTSGDWSFIVVGHKGSYHSTVEGKTTLDHASTITDEGPDALTGTRADLRIVGDADGKLTVYWQEPGTTPDAWIPYRGDGQLPGTQPDYGPQVYVGLITYANYTNGLPFVGTCDALESLA